MIKKKELLRFCGSVTAASHMLGVSHQAVSKMPDRIPRTAERKVRAKVAAFIETWGKAE